MIHTSSREHYITGMPALSVPTADELADWHLSAAFSGRKALPIAGVNHPSTEHLWGLVGVEERSAFLRGVGFINDDHGPVFMAVPARAIADLLFGVLARKQDPHFLCIDHIHLSDHSLTLLASLVQLFLEQAPSPELRRWIEENPVLGQCMTLPV